jgi:serine protease AprX
VARTWIDQQPAARGGRSRRIVAAGATVVVAATLAGAASGATSQHSGAATTDGATTGATAKVLVRTSGALDATAALVERSGGQVTRRLPVIDGFAATVPAAVMPQLRSSAGVVGVTPDTAVRFLAADTPWPRHPVPAPDQRALARVAQAIGATDAYRAGYTGKGVDVAVIDTGVAPVEGLTSGNVVDGPDLSFDSQSPDLAHLDAFGHGTHIASLIAGRDKAGPPASYAAADAPWHGIAPDARIISVKVGAADGATDVSQVIAAVDWVVAHRDDGDVRIRVLNLSFGTDGMQSPDVDPLAFAVENATRHGITVVAAAGNGGAATTRLANPAQDPYVIAVGAATRAAPPRSRTTSSHRSATAAR